MKLTSLYSAGAALLALAACNDNTASETAAANAAVAANKTAAATAPAELPPAIKAEKTLRCKDNSLIYVTFFQGDKQAVVRTEQNGTPTTLKAANAGEPLTAEGFSLTGGPDNVTVTLPGKGEQICHT